MARTEALSILTEEDGKEFLSELYGKVIENVQKKLVSLNMKNTDLSGDPESGSVEAKRFCNAEPQDYGTARAAGAGKNVKAKPIVVNISEDKEIVEEIAKKDTLLYGVKGLIELRAKNHTQRMAASLDRDFFSVAANDAVSVEIADGTVVEDELEAVIQECENTKNDFVDGVPRDIMKLVCGTVYYGKLRNHLDKMTRANVDTTDEEFFSWHGVECESSTNLPTGVKYILMVKGAVAQPVRAETYNAEKIPLSEDYAVSLFYHYGTKSVMPDLIFKGVEATS